MVGKLVKEYGALFGIDGIQAVGCVPVNVTECQADFLSADGHKWMLGPEGAGVLYVSPDLISELDGAFAGWIGRDDFMNLESRNLKPAGNARRFEEGALNFAGVLGMGGSLELINEIGIEEIWERTWKLREHVRHWGTESMGWKCVSPAEKDSSNGTVTFLVNDDVQNNGDGNPEEADRLVKVSGSVNVFVSQRRGFLRFAPHFYQSEELVLEALRRIESEIRSS